MKETRNIFLFFTAIVLPLAEGWAKIFPAAGLLDKSSADGCTCGHSSVLFSAKCFTMILLLNVSSRVTVVEKRFLIGSQVV